jgi:hypothetical protein
MSHGQKGKLSRSVFGRIFEVLRHRTLDKGPKEPFFSFGINVLITFKSAAGIQNWRVLAGLWRMGAEPSRLELVGLCRLPIGGMPPAFRLFHFFERVADGAGCFYLDFVR